MRRTLWNRRFRSLLTFASGFLCAAVLFSAILGRPSMGRPAGHVGPERLKRTERAFSGNLYTADIFLEVPLPQVEAPPPELELPAHPGILLNVANILQKPELPNGCEATSVAIALRYLGYPADKMDIASNYLPKQQFTVGIWGWIGGDPEVVYPGNPTPGGSGYYCFPGVVMQTANLYLAAQNAPYAAANHTGATEEELLTLLDACVPVIVWNTLGSEPPAKSSEMVWFLGNSDKLYVPYVNLHVSVLRGYDDKYFYFSDPLGLYEKTPRADFMEVYTTLGSRAVAIRKLTELSSTQAAEARLQMASALQD